MSPSDGANVCHLRIPERLDLDFQRFVTERLQPDLVDRFGDRMTRSGTLNELRVLRGPLDGRRRDYLLLASSFVGRIPLTFELDQRWGRMSFNDQFHELTRWERP